MKIIRQGTNPASTPLRGECRCCRTLIEFHPMEAKFVPDQRDGDFYQIDCPTCPSTITVNAPSGYNGPG